MTYSQAWLEDQTAVRGIFVEVTFYDMSGTPVTRYLSNVGYMTTDAVTSFLPVITAGIQFNETISLDGSISLSYGDLEMKNPNGIFDSLLDSTQYVWTNGTIKIYHGDPFWVSATLADMHGTFQLVFDGIIADIDSKGYDSLNIRIRDKMERLNTPISDNVLGNYGTWVGAQPNIDTVRPLVFGEVFNKEPLLIDPATLEYMFNDTCVGTSVSNTTTSTNLITCKDTSKFVLNAPITFTKSTVNGITGTVFGNIVENTVYYIKTINSNTTFTISATSGGSVFTLATAAGTMLAEANVYASQNLIEVRDNGIPIYTTGQSYLSTTVTATTVTSNHLTVVSTSFFVIGSRIIFSGTTFGNIVAGATYYVHSIVDATHLTISSDASNVYEYTLVNGSGSSFTLSHLQQVIVNNTTGKFKLTVALAGVCTVSVQGIKKSINLNQITINEVGLLNETYNNNIANLIALITTQYGNSLNRLSASDLDLPNLEAFQTANLDRVGLSLSDRENILTVCSDLANSLSAQIYFNRLGKLQILRLGVPTTDASVTITDRDILHHSLVVSNRTEVVAATTLGYCQNYTVQSNLLTSIPTAHKDIFATEWLNAKATDEPTRVLYKLDVTPVQKDTKLITSASAQREANRLNNYYKTKQTIYKFTGTSRLLSLKLGQPVQLITSRYGIYNSGTGKTAQVVSLTPNWLDSTVEVEVLINVADAAGALTDTTTYNTNDTTLQVTSPRVITNSVIITTTGGVTEFSSPGSQAVVSPASITMTATPQGYSAPIYLWEYALSGTQTTWIPIVGSSTDTAGSSILTITSGQYVGILSTGGFITYRCTVSQSLNPTTKSSIDISRSVQTVYGADSTMYYIDSTSPVITKDAKDAATVGTYSNITVTGNRTVGDVTTTPYGYLTVTANGDSEAATATANTITTNISSSAGKSYYTVKMYNQATVSSATLYDTQVFQVVYNGLDAVTAVLSNDSHTIATDSAGNNAVYTSSGTDIFVYEGSTALTYDGVGTSNSTWTVSSSGSNITPGTVTDMGPYARYGAHSAITADTATITYTITGKNSKGSAVSLTKTQTFTKGKAGTPGSDAPIVILTSPTQRFLKPLNDTTLTPVSIVITATTINITSPVYNWYMSSDNGATFGASLGTASTYTVASFSNDLSRVYKCIVTGTTAQGTAVSTFDQLSILYLDAGSETLQAGLGNEHQSVTCDKDGNIAAGQLPLSSNMVVVRGATVLATPAVSFSKVSDTGMTSTINSTTGIISVSAVSATSASGVYRATIGTTTLDKTLTVNKSLAGQTGAVGRTIALAAGRGGFVYNNATSSALLTSPATTIITATAYNTVGTPYYEFLVGATSAQNTTTNTYTYTAQNLLANMPEKITVNLREGTDSSTILATDSTHILGIQNGSKVVQTYLGNETHSFSASNLGVVSSYVGSGTTLQVSEGVNILTESSTLASNSTFRVTSAVGTGITVGAVSGAGTTILTYAAHSAMSGDTASILYTIEVKNSEGITASYTTVQTFSKAKAGNATASISIDNSGPIFRYSAASGISPAGGIALTTTVQGFTGTPLYEWYKDNVLIAGAASSSYTVPTAHYSGLLGPFTYKVIATGTINGTAGSTLNDSVTIPKLIDGSNAPTVVLSNGNNTFPASTSGYAGITFTSGICYVTAYIGTTQLAYATSGNSTFSVVMTNEAAITIATGSGSGNTYTVPAPTAMSSDSTFTTLAVQIRDASGALVSTITSKITYSLSRTGSTGSTGAAGTNGTNGAAGTNGTNGAAGTNGAMTYRMYASTTNSTTTPTIAATTTSGTAPTGSNMITTWQASPITLTGSQAQWQTDGAQPAGSTTTTWSTPYLSYFKVAKLSAIVADIGNLTITSGGNISSGKISGTDTVNAGFWLGNETAAGTTPKFFIGNAGDTKSLNWNGTALTIKGDIAGTSSIDITGKARFGGSTTDQGNINVMGSSAAWTTTIYCAPSTNNIGIIGQADPAKGSGSGFDAISVGVYGQGSILTGTSIGVFGYGYYGMIGRSYQQGGTGIVGQLNSTVGSTATAIGTGVGIRGDAPTASSGTITQSIGVYGNGPSSGLGLAIYSNGKSRFTDTIESTLADGTAPLILTSKTMVSNLNSQFLNNLPILGNANKDGSTPVNWGGTSLGAIPYINTVGVIEIGKYIDFHATNVAMGTNGDNDVRLEAIAESAPTPRAGQGTLNVWVGAGGAVIASNLGGYSPIAASAFNVNSSIAFKENVIPITNSFQSVLSLVGVTYDRKNNTTKNEAGLIAEEVHKVLPNVIAYNNDGSIFGINYNGLIPYLIEAIKSLKAEIDELKGSR